MTTTMSIPMTVAAVAFDGAEKFTDRPAFRHKADDTWVDRSYAELRDDVERVAAGLIAFGIEPGDRVAILSETRPEWSTCQFGAAAAGAIVVPIYPSSSPDECEWVVGDSGATVVICEDAEQAAKVERVRERLPELREIFVVEPARGHRDLDELCVLGTAAAREQVAQRVAERRPTDPALIIYTSGSTGRPKGCILTHDNLMAPAHATLALDTILPGETSYLFLPLAHVFAQVIAIAVTSVGGVVAFNSGGSKTIISDLAEVRPESMPSVPRIFEKVYAQFSSAVPADTLAQWSEAGFRARELEAAGQPVPEDVQQIVRAAEPVFAKARAVFGDRIRVAISGAAPIAPEILTFLHAAGVPVYEGYGLSESTAMGTLNAPGALRIGTIGRAVPQAEVRIAEDGEILLRGPHIFAGYWNNPEATEAALDGEWLRTGDLGSIDDDGYVRITGRKKDIIITAGGKNITPSEIENDVRQCPLISHAVMHGDRRPYPVAVITLDEEMAVPWAAERGLPTDPAELSKRDEVRAVVQEVVDGVNARYTKAMHIKRFAILEREFATETGELTPTLKIKRKVINEMYADVFDRLYT